MLKNTIEILDAYKASLPSADPENGYSAEHQKLDKAIDELIEVVPAVKKAQREQLRKQLRWPKTGFSAIDMLMANSDMLCTEYRMELAVAKKQLRLDKHQRNKRAAAVKHIDDWLSGQGFPDGSPEFLKVCEALEVLRQ